MLAAGCGGQAPDGRAGPLVGPSPAPPAASSRPLVPEAAFPVGLVATPDGSVLYAERLTGRVRAIGPDGVLRPEPVAEVAVAGATDDQRGLVGLSRLADGRLALAWVRPGDGRLVVGVRDADAGSGTEPQVIWIGPVSADLANGGGLAAATDGSILIGIGDLLQDRGLAQDPTVPNRKVLALDPDAGPDQSPRILSVGWNNPSPSRSAPTGRPGVADNSEGEAPSGSGGPIDPPPRPVQ
ncbi:MAG: PQQ-dependent sugar dehydrogenase [Acidimicrobiales bacterium]